MAINWDRMRAALSKLQGTSEIQSAVESPAVSRISRDRLVILAQQAATACTQLCRAMLNRNMVSAKIKSAGLSAAINHGQAVYNQKRGSVRFRFTSSFNPYGTRGRGGVWMVAAAQDAGRVVGLKGLEAFSAKRRIKKNAGVAGSNVKVVPGKHFFQFSPAQSSQIQRKFRYHFEKLVQAESA